MIPFVAALCALLLALAPTPARAQDDPGRILFEAGASDYESGDYQHALSEFQRAYELSQRAQLFYNISLCYQQLGDLEHAVEFLGRYLSEAEQVPNRATLERRRANLTRRIEAQRAAATDGATTNSAASDSSASATTNSAASDSPASDSPASDSPASDSAATDSAATDSPASDSAAADSAATDSAASNRPSAHEGGANVPAIISLIGGGVGVALGVTFGVMALSEDSSVSSQACAATRSCTNAGKIDTYALLSDVSTGLAVVGLGLGLIFLLTAHDEENPTRARVDFTPFVGPNAAGLTAQGRF